MLLQMSSSRLVSEDQHFQRRLRYPSSGHHGALVMVDWGARRLQRLPPRAVSQVTFLWSIVDSKAPVLSFLVHAQKCQGIKVSFFGLIGKRCIVVCLQGEELGRPVSTAVCHGGCEMSH
eukprot:TRINITY_DN14225_c0_g1_i1.p1 TRINITY_DN14225_c0_g1~~TRINITY_DN14225_c0_g1_i1.p1  ORF type:complete len:119 (-),score=9.79 TRINITY_DN14225_c0_g1_i1:83-439(-)